MEVGVGSDEDLFESRMGFVRTVPVPEVGEDRSRARDPSSSSDPVVSVVLLVGRCTAATAEEVVRVVLEIAADRHKGCLVVGSHPAAADLALA